MANTAANLVDRVLPAVPVRQRVLSLPWELRALAAFKADVLSAPARRRLAQLPNVGALEPEARGKR